MSELGTEEHLYMKFLSSEFALIAHRSLLIASLR